MGHLQNGCGAFRDRRGRCRFDSTGIERPWTYSFSYMHSPVLALCEGNLMSTSPLLESLPVDIDMISSIVNYVSNGSKMLSKSTAYHFRGHKILVFRARSVYSLKTPCVGKGTLLELQEVWEEPQKQEAMGADYLDLRNRSTPLGLFIV
jgi:hypothetical protein